MTILLSVEAASVSAVTGEIVAPVSFSLKAGRPFTILGETGSGKSLLAQAIIGVLPEGLTATGSVTIEGRTLSLAEPKLFRPLWGRKVAVLPQEPWLALDPTMVALEQVAEGHRYLGRLEEDESISAARTDLEALGVIDAEAKLPGQLSGGMAQRVAFAAARAGGARIIIADEPTKGLDADRRGEVLTLLQRAQQQGMSLLCITHDVWLARALGGELAVMLEGRMVERGQAEALLAQPGHAYTRRLLAADPACWAQPAATVSTASAPASSVLVELSEVAKSFGEQPLFSGISARLHAGEIVAVSGPSGVGKTTFGNIVLGLLRPDAGQVTRAAGLARTAFQKIYQDPAAAFAPTVTLRQSLRDLVRLHGLDWQPLEDLLARMRLCPSLLERLPRQVSGGELQRIALARVLLMRPALIFADEPTSRLDPLTQQEVIALLVEQAREAGSAVLLVTHDAQIVRCVADRRLLLGPPP